MNVRKTESGIPSASKVSSPAEAVINVSRCEPYDDIARILKTFKVKLNPKCDVIYYPGSATDTSPSEIFPQARVMYVDTDEKSVSALKQDGKEAYRSSAFDFVPNTQIDLLVLFGAGTFRRQPAKYVAVGGYVICNNYFYEEVDGKYDNFELAGDDFELVGIVADNPNKSIEEPYIFDTNKSGFAGYEKPVENDEEFKQVSNDYWFNMATRLVKELTGKTTNITEEYAKLLESGKKVYKFGEMHRAYIFHEDRPPTLLLPLPTLKPVSAFVFQRIKREQLI